MFLKNSRYYGFETVATQDRQGRSVMAVKLRSLPPIAGLPYAVQGHDRLDLLADQTYQDATRFWFIADANSELEANELTRTVGRVIRLPQK